MGISYAKQIHSVNNMTNAVRCFDNSSARNQVSQVTFKLTSNTADTTLDEYIGDALLSDTTVNVCFIGVVNDGTTKNSKTTTVQSEGDIALESIILTSTSAVTSVNDDFTIKALLYQTGWSPVRWTSSETAFGSVIHQLEAGGSSVTRSYDTHTITGDIQMDAALTPASTNAHTDRPMILRKGDCLILEGSTEPSLVADVIVTVRYRRLVPGAKFGGMATVAD